MESGTTVVYLDLLIQSMEKKVNILNQLISVSKDQKEAMSQDLLNVEQFDQSYEKKNQLIDDLNQLDSGFTTIYDRVKDELHSNKDPYKDRILRLKQLISEVTTKSITLQGIEAQNKLLFESAVNRSKGKIKQRNISSQVAASYYTQMSNQFGERYNQVDRKR